MDDFGDDLDFDVNEIQDCGEFHIDADFSLDHGNPIDETEDPEAPIDYAQPQQDANSQDSDEKNLNDIAVNQEEDEDDDDDQDFRMQTND